MELLVVCGLLKLLLPLRISIARLAIQEQEELKCRYPSLSRQEIATHTRYIIPIRGRSRFTMHASAFHVGILAIPFVVAEQHHATRPRQTGSTTTPSRVESGINTECKTCPYELCINAAAYDSSTDLTLTCWTRGETIVDTNLWYKTTDGCYVTEWDIIEGNCKSWSSSGSTSSSRTVDTGVISYCGEVEETYTQGPSRTVFNTECNIVPDFVPELADHTKMYQPDIDLTLTCYTDDGSQVLGNRYAYCSLSLAGPDTR